MGGIIKLNINIINPFNVIAASVFIQFLLATLLIYHFHFIALVCIARSTTVKDIGYCCLSSQIVDLVYV